ncbi:phosphopantetheine-binding protein [uncultured Mailhella sp.]|uniref:acyl carrier protein n=1 Tax=uncultured Mailhella sp. TaxID=1981031 RepID=UPI00262E7C39|nr:phosphopantetheine-binding protein [uncultured Mailhella sp.]
MTYETIVHTVNTAFAEEFEVAPEKLLPEAHIKNDLGLDSLDIVDMIIVLEQAFNFKLQDRSAVANITTLGELYDFISKLQDLHA